MTQANRRGYDDDFNLNALEDWNRMKLAESAFRFWDNPDDAVYDTL